MFVPELSYSELKRLNCEAGSGVNNDSSFIIKLALAIWGRDVLATRSVTGLRSQTYPGLEQPKLVFIYGKPKKYPFIVNILFNIFMYKNFQQKNYMNVHGLKATIKKQH